MLAVNRNLINFKSNPYRDAELARLRELERQRELERERQRQEALKREQELQNNRINVLEELKQEILSYPNIDNDMSKRMAGFLSQFTCAIQNSSEHDIQEFFGDEQTAAKLREKLSPECQSDSLKLRQEFQKIDETQDPVMMLIAANNMKKFAPKPGTLNPEQQLKLLDGLKETVLTAIKNSDLTKFDNDDRIFINEMVQMIEVADSVDFGISVKLQALVDKLNKKKLNIGFIPPVPVKHLEQQAVQTAVKTV